FQLQNAAAVLMALDSIKNQLPVTQDDVRRGLLQVALPGRFQLFTQPRRTIVDVAHNLQGARALAQTLKEQPCTGKTLAVFAMLRDKDIEQVVGVLDGVVERWHCAGLAVPRGLQGVELMQRMSHIPLRGVVMLHSDVVEAYSAACEEAESVDRIVVFGSFYTVAQIMGEGIIAA
ncbi:MAG: dihydrofolate synthase / folylpolyglutamate synthase, partial [Halothiobacillaceae bacterium]